MYQKSLKQAEPRVYENLVQIIKSEVNSEKFELKAIFEVFDKAEGRSSRYYYKHPAMFHMRQYLYRHMSGGYSRLKKMLVDIAIRIHHDEYMEELKPLIKQCEEAGLNINWRSNDSALRKKCTKFYQRSIKSDICSIVDSVMKEELGL